MIKVVDDFNDYEIIDSGNGMKYERWNNVYLLRPDPTIIWNNDLTEKKKIDAIYHRSNKGGGYWELKKDLKTWTVSYQDLKFNLKLMGFKHTGLFPEQAINWNFLREKVKNAKRPVKALNLFAYTGGASIALLKENASVVHVDASRGMIEWAKENVKLNNLEDKSIRFLVDDVVKFVKREIRRGNKYDIIIMDPPSYGKGANGEVWSLEKDLYNLIELCQSLLSDTPICLMVNSYSGLSPIILENILKLTKKQEYKKIETYEIGLKITNNNLILPCGITGIIEYE